MGDRGTMQDVACIIKPARSLLDPCDVRRVTVVCASHVRFGNTFYTTLSNVQAFQLDDAT